MINRKHAIINDRVTGHYLYKVKDKQLYFSVKGYGLELYIPTLELLADTDHLIVLTDVTIETSFNFRLFSISPVCPNQVGSILSLVKMHGLTEPVIQVSQTFFNAAYGIKDK